MTVDLTATVPAMDTVPATATACMPAADTEAGRIAFWEDAARRLDWTEPWHTAHRFEKARRLSAPEVSDDEAEYTVPIIEWFSGGELNVAYNCVDRHVAAGRGNKVALYFEGEPGDRRAVTYADLQKDVSRAANALTDLGIVPGDRVVIYLPVLVETVVITLACARIGAVHSLVFGGFSAEALKFRIEDTGAKLLVTTDGQFRRGVAVQVKANADTAVSGSASIEHVLVVRRTSAADDQPGGEGRRFATDTNPAQVTAGPAPGRQDPARTDAPWTGVPPTDVPWTEGRDLWWHDVVGSASDVHEPEAFDAETPLFIMYTSGTTGTPKGLVHTSGGYLTQAAHSHELLFGHPNPAARDTDVHWCTADLAWVTAHTYEIYGPLANGVTQVIYEGTPDTPHPGRHFEIIERYGVTSYYTAPTLVRSLMGAFPDGIPGRYNLDSIRVLGTVGEATNPAAWHWFRTNLGRGQVPVVDT